MESYADISDPGSIIIEISVKHTEEYYMYILVNEHYIANNPVNFEVY